MKLLRYIHIYKCKVVCTCRSLEDLGDSPGRKDEDVFRAFLKIGFKYSQSSTSVFFLA